MPFRTWPIKKTSSLFPDEESTAKPAASPPITAFIDGGARGNPGPAGFGVHIEDAAGKMIAELSEYLGHQTNNVAEYSGLLAALDYAVQHHYPSLKVVSDSELLVKQMRGDYKVKSPELKALYDRARPLIRKLTQFEIRHVLRAQNKNADRLANAAMDKGMGRVPATSATQPSDKEFNGIVRNGLIELLSGELRDGTRVKVKVVKN
ncbi:MAG TPA: ribonuclease HI family protein [Terriglobales bacterium]|nr:ribonuclease HI family protein [Terriglobales bacterium]